MTDRVFAAAHKRYRQKGERGGAWLNRWAATEPAAVRRWLLARDRRAAFHEAGHVVANLAAGKRIVVATIRSDRPDAIGHVESCGRAPEGPDGWIRYCATMPAGKWAEILYVGTDFDQLQEGASGDDARLEELLAHVSDGHRALARNLIEREALRVVRDHGDAVRVIARALMRRKRLAHRDVSRLLEPKGLWPTQLSLRFQ